MTVEKFNLVIDKLEDGRPVFTGKLHCLVCQYIFVNPLQKEPECPKCGAKERDKEV